MTEQMNEVLRIKKVGGSAAIYLSKEVLKVYGLGVGDKVEVEYRYPKIIIKKHG